MPTDQNQDIVPTLRMFDGLMMKQAADEIERLRAQLQTPNASLPPLGDGPRRDLVVTVSVPANWESRLDMQWVLEREIHADRWRWNSFFSHSSGISARMSKIASTPLK